MDEIIVTVFTATYNRGYILNELYQSLSKQTDFRFEWIVVDDGSSDQTEDLFRCWKQQQNQFNIQYYKKKNGGKHRAINYGIKKAKGRLFFIVDSDDRLPYDSINQIINWEKEIDRTDKFAGFSGNIGHITQSHKIIGTSFEGDYVDAKYNEREKKNIKGDKAEIYFTDILKNYPFPEFENENFITERVVWDKIAEDGYKLRWFNKIIYLAEYLPDGLSENGDDIFKKSPKGNAYNIRQMERVYKYSYIQKLRNYNSYYEMEKDLIGIKEICTNLKIKKITLIIAVLLTKIYRKIKY